jgi:hypothetical protein
VAPVHQDVSLLQEHQTRASKLVSEAEDHYVKVHKEFILDSLINREVTVFPEFPLIPIALPKKNGRPAVKASAKATTPCAPCLLLHVVCARCSMCAVLIAPCALCFAPCALLRQVLKAIAACAFFRFLLYVAHCAQHDMNETFQQCSVMPLVLEVACGTTQPR